MSTQTSDVRSWWKVLCAICSDIDFDRYLCGDIKVPIRLGSWENISHRQDCPFCRLILRSMQSDPRITPLQTDEELVLRNEVSWKLGIELSPYDRTRSESYSNKYDLRSKAKECNQTAYRFLVFAEDDVEEDHVGQQGKRGIIQYLAHRERNPQNRQFFGRRVDREKIDSDLLRSWLNRCSKWHNGDCEGDIHEAEGVLENLRLIDTRYIEIVKFSDDKIPPYVALSYVWGTAEMKETGKVPAMLLRRDIRWDFDEERTPLDPVLLPKTIQDAISLTKTLGYRYLWVDALCIVQDASLKEKHIHLKNMKLIYSCASLTIAAAAGGHADYGIAGIGVPRKFSQYSEVINGLRLATMFPSFTALENSSELLWNTRGWTFQEKLLSKRLLIFTDFQVYFKCAESIWTEEIMMETERLSKSAEARRAKYSWNPDRQHRPEEKAMMYKVLNPKFRIEDDWNYLGGFLDYAAAVQEFSKRNLTDPKDTLFAIGGVLQTLSNVTGRFVMGLPQKHFLESLLWYPEVGCVQIYNSGLELPSWSWTSSQFAKGGVSFHLMDVRQLRSLLLATMEGFHELRAFLGLIDEKDWEDWDLRSDPRFGPYLELLNIGTRAVTMKGMYGNLLTCLQEPLLEKDHTIKRIFYRDEESGLEAIDFDLPISAFNLPEPHPNRLIPALIKVAEAHSRSSDSHWKPNTRSLAAQASSPSLIFKTVIVKFCIGESLCARTTSEEDEVGVFELRNRNGETVGETTTTYRTVAARQGRHHAERDFLTVSWGLSLQKANVHPSWVPRWKFDSEGVEHEELTAKRKAEKEAKKMAKEKKKHPKKMADKKTTKNQKSEKMARNEEGPEKSFAKMTMAEKASWETRDYLIGRLKIHSEEGLFQVAEPLIADLDRYVPGRWLGVSSSGEAKEKQEDTLFRQLYMARKGEEIPRSLWAVVNLIMVEWRGGRAVRVGVGKVVVGAWKEGWGEGVEVEFG